VASKSATTKQQQAVKTPAFAFETKPAHGYSPKHTHQPIVHPLKNPCHIYYQVAEDTARIATGGRVQVGCWLKRSYGYVGYREDERKTPCFENFYS
jgi:hypothetical protein